MKTQSNNASRKIQTIMIPGTIDSGEPILSVLVKRTYIIENGKQAIRKSFDNDLAVTDTYSKRPLQSSLLYATDYIPYKMNTDVLFHGKAHTANHQQEYEIQAEFRIQDYQKRFAVIGDRICTFRSIRNPLFSDPKPFTEMSITYELAYGGVDTRKSEDAVYAFPLNPLGKGFMVEDRKETITSLSLPNIEDPDNLLTPYNIGIEKFEKWPEQPKPQGLLPMPGNWHQRARFCGILPHEWKSTTSLKTEYTRSVSAKDKEHYQEMDFSPMDFRFFNCASEGLVLPYLQGDELVTLKYLSISPFFEFQLPYDTVNICITLGDGIQEPEVRIHTVYINMEKSEMDIVYCGAIPYPGPEFLSQLTECEIKIIE